MIPAPCPLCSHPVAIVYDRVQVRGCPLNVAIVCSDACDESAPIAHGSTEAAALEMWDDLVEERSQRGGR